MDASLQVLLEHILIVLLNIATALAAKWIHNDLTERIDDLQKQLDDCIKKENNAQK